MQVQSLQHDPKMKGSQFVEFISKMSTGTHEAVGGAHRATGELEIKDGELIHHDGPQQLPGVCEHGHQTL